MEHLTMPLANPLMSYIQGINSQTIQLACWPCDKPKALVHILHGMGEHKYRYQHFAEFLNTQKIQVYAHDHLGHGDSISEQSPIGHFGDDAGFKNIVANVNYVQQHLQNLYPDLPVYLLGHSMGSFIAQSYLINYPNTIRGLILTGSALSPKPLMHALKFVARVEMLRLGKRGTSRIINYLTFGSYNTAFKPTRTEFDWLSRDKNTVNQYISDAFCGFICSCASWSQLADGLLQISAPKQLQKISANLPTLIISGNKDPVGGFGKYFHALVAHWKKTGHTHVTSHLLADARHEVLNENDREFTYNIITKWIRSL
jgi:alpha-beta hydrolase superfamily lysophospholipase